MSDSMDALRDWLDAVTEVVEAAKATGRSAHTDDCPDRLCVALRRYDAANTANTARVGA